LAFRENFVFAEDGSNSAMEAIAKRAKLLPDEYTCDFSNGFSNSNGERV